jgi:hypothetical protein
MLWVDGAASEHQLAAKRWAAPALEPSALEQGVRIIEHFNSLDMRKKISPGEAAEFARSLSGDGVTTRIEPRHVLDNLCCLATYRSDTELLEGEVGRAGALLFG